MRAEWYSQLLVRAWVTERGEKVHMKLIYAKPCPHHFKS